MSNVTPISLAAQLARAVNPDTINEQRQEIHTLQGKLFMARTALREAERSITVAERSGFIEAIRKVRDVLSAKGSVTRADLRALVEGFRRDLLGSWRVGDG